jgi:hypothetical protein
VDQNLGIKEGGGTDAGVIKGSESEMEMEVIGGDGDLRWCWRWSQRINLNNGYSSNPRMYIWWQRSNLRN